MQLYYNGFIPFCVYTTYFTLPPLVQCAHIPFIDKVKKLMNHSIHQF
ncbi:protein of unknown function [Streptococcus thermophilus]|uniref:Uncharacterized protein n=1 Tax=Streptococcus thermophilus TaxID=1308 RepID=A0AAU9H616_STRTR|nr:protein of unknown function [Streptococcus thermophilus]